ncbi:MAG: adenosine deaminase [Pseudomonadota bacterium]
MPLFRSLTLALVAVSLVGCSTFEVPRLGSSSNEAAAARAFDNALDDHAALRQFLKAMPKGGDLHTHPPGAVYAESMLAWAAEEDSGICLIADETRLILCNDPAAERSGAVHASVVLTDEPLRNRLIDAFSMRNISSISPGGPRSGADHFFSTFERFIAVWRVYPGRSFAWQMETAARQNVSYIEPTWVTIIPNPADYGVTEALSGGTDEDFAAYEQALLDGGFQAAVGQGRDQLDATLQGAREVLRCDEADAMLGCSVTVRHLGAVARVLPPELVFTQVMVHFMLASEEDSSVGINILAPEHDRVAIQDYALHMRMMRYFKAKYPDVRLSLHAGELWLGLVETADLDDHIATAISVAGAERIGHGIDIGFEDNSEDLLALMAAKGIAVEVNLSSNEAILGVAGDDHPISTYLAAGVPIVLSTDDEGVLRSDITREYQTAATRHGLDYRDLKKIARRSIEVSFLEGDSLWSDFDRARPVEPCADGLDTEACSAFLAASARARVQADLEHRYTAFEAGIAGL